VSIARIEPDNSILPLVKAFSQRPRGAKLVVLGSFDPDNAYHASVLAAAGEEVVFPGAIYDAATVQALRYHARAYVHGHTVGGTNPSLVEALWAGNAVIAHDNVYNRWTAGEAGLFFSDEAQCAGLMEQLLRDDALVARLSAAARTRAVAEFSWGPILAQYEGAARRFLTESVQLAGSSEQRV
jgi:glycosyltransferase involved in cell wall biosynthesis